MAKLISVADDVYNELSARKGKESFSAAIRKLMASRGNKERFLRSFGGGGVDERMVKKARGMWKKWSEKYA